jgi:hypothetical protein
VQKFTSCGQTCASHPPHPQRFVSGVVCTGEKKTGAGIPLFSLSLFSTTLATAFPNNSKALGRSDFTFSGSGGVGSFTFSAEGGVADFTFLGER